jgi:hypothetical protein
MEKGKFEDNWKDAFQGAEIGPSDHVWTNIELGLEKNESGGIRRKLLFYQTLAAASIIFALAVGASSVYFFRDNGTGSMNRLALKEVEKLNSKSSDAVIVTPNEAVPSSSNQSEIESNTFGTVVAQNSENHSSGIVKTRTKLSGTKYGLGSTINEVSQNISSENEELTGRKIDNSQNQLIAQTGSLDEIPEQGITRAMTLDAAALPSLAKVPEAAYEANPEEEKADPVALMLAKLEDREKEISKSEKKTAKSQENLWTSVGFAAGSFNSTGSHISATNTNSAIQSNNTIAKKEAAASGTAYSVGVNMGKRVTARWVVQGGVNYLNQSSDYTAQTAVASNNLQSFRPESINELDKLNQGDAVAEENKIITTAPYNVNNNVRYLSVPLQAGYQVINHKFGVQLNAGVSTDLFLNNIKTAEGKSVDKINQGIGDDSPYRAMNFSGLLGTEISYRFSERYRIALNPGLRYPFSSVYKADLGVQSAPLTFDVGLRFRYIFH